MKRLLVIVSLLTVFSLVGVLGAGAVGAQDQPTETTEAPTPSPTDAPDDGGDAAELSSVVLLVILIVIAGIAIFALGRSSRSPTPAPTAPPPQQPTATAWQGRARAAYSNARWLADNMTDDLATWRGTTVHDPASAEAGDRRTSTWASIADRTDSTVAELYRLEAEAPTAEARDTVRDVVDGINGTRSALEARAEARTARLAAEASGAPSDADREARAAADLEQSRSRLSRALERMAAVT